MKKKKRRLVPVKTCAGPCVFTRSRPLRAERRSLFSSSRPLEIHFLIRLPALMNICSSGTPTAKMSEFVFAPMLFLSHRLTGCGGRRETGEQAELKRPFTYSPERLARQEKLATSVGPPAPSPHVASACLVNYVRLFSQPGL